MRLSFLCLAIALLLCSCATQSTKPPVVVAAVDLQRYAGKWHEIAAFPAWFQRGCTCSTAEYSLRDDGRMRVVNTCSKEGKIKSVEGVARVVAGSNNARLKVSFQWPFEGDYWVIALDEKDYQWVVVGTPGRDYLWLLSRTPDIAPQLEKKLVAIAANQGFDVSKLVKTCATKSR